MAPVVTATFAMEQIELPLIDTEILVPMDKHVELAVGFNSGI